MKVSAYLHLQRVTGTGVSGVGRHAIEVLSRLAGRPGVDAEWVAAADDFDAFMENVPAKLGTLPNRRLPWRRKPLEVCWKATNHPSVDSWLEAPDWIYCPAETILPTRRSRLAVTVHDMHPLEKGLPWTHNLPHLRTALAWRHFIPRMIRRADLIMAVSEFTRERIERMFPAALGKCIVIGNGVDLDEFCPPTEKAEVQDKPFVLIVGGLREQKGGDLVLEAAKRLHSIGSNLQFKITGRSLAHLESEARRLPNVSLCGYVPATEMPDLYRRATALYFPSRYEGFGLPIVEALACLTPVVCSDQPALLEAARGAALTTSAADPTRATDLLRRLEIDPAFREAQRERALRVRRELGWDPVVNRVTEALNPN